MTLLLLLCAVIALGFVSRMINDLFSVVEDNGDRHVIVYTLMCLFLFLDFIFCSFAK